MRPRAGLASLAFLFWAGTCAEASSSLVLTDGQIIKGTEVQRQGDSYLVTIAGGNTVSFPAALVKEVKFEDDPPAPAPPGFDYSGPKTLAGPPGPPLQNPSDPLKVMGPPTTWSKDAVDTTWVPTNAYDTSKDVMAGSRSTWSKSAVDTTWAPQDGFGFKKLSFTGPAPATQPELTSTYDKGEVAPLTTAQFGPSPWTCAERLFARDADRPATDKDNRSASMDVKSVKSPLSKSLGVPLYEANGTLGGVPRKAVFTIAAGECRLVGGDADALIGLNLPVEHAMAQDAASFNAAMAGRGGALVPSGVDKLDYALAFVSLTDPAVSGSTAATLKLIDGPEDLRSIATKTPGTCSLSKGKRRREERDASKSYAVPKIAAGKEGDVVTFLTWSSAGGSLYRNTVVIARSGVVTAKRDVLASHIGAHTE